MREGTRVWQQVNCGRDSGNLPLGTSKTAPTRTKMNPRTTSNDAVWSEQFYS